ncbi:dienelactone hydrolase family protein [Streptomyces hoynatensis]|uniref:Dienelactone hydrolase family protein n=1 Tax=Streptomyces hoynatensis TaxID=1141874 RepID=A0A3A9YYZ6_9ACTN|nr:dienelactone hydrolase family protein [Streptomyces hoynatensis]RKN41243.1 dienelactone hydrolase family protein [Streptomyces hoynatensis]
MTVHVREVGYSHEGTPLSGVLTLDGDAPVRRPAVLVLHGMEGRSQAQTEFAARLTRWGYAGFAADLFGIGDAGDAARGEPLMNAFLHDRARLLRRMRHLLDVLKEQPEVDPERVAAIGFCFGGLCVLDLARGGASLRAVASFHGVLTPPEQAERPEIRARIAVFHGWDDPYAPPADVLGLARELTERGCDWQLHAYGHAMHSFMAPAADAPEAGIAYDEKAARRAWETCGSFLAESFA